MGDNWQVQTLHYLPGNVFFQSPDVEMLRIFDLLDRGLDPDGAIGWMRTNGLPDGRAVVSAARKAVIGLQYVCHRVAEQGVRERNLGNRPPGRVAG